MASILSESPRLEKPRKKNLNQSLSFWANAYVKLLENSGVDFCGETAFSCLLLSTRSTVFYLLWTFFYLFVDTSPLLFYYIFKVSFIVQKH
ncbi:hypothetical protein [Pseudoramibacter alactolyticus]